MVIVELALIWFAIACYLALLGAYWDHYKKNYRKKK